MSDLKITVDKLKNYLGTGLKIRHCGDIHVLNGLFKDEVYVSHKTKRGNFIPTSGPLETMQPICYRLSDLDKEIEHNGKRFVPLNELFQIAYESIYGMRFDGTFDKNPELGKYLAVKAEEVVGGNEWNYGFTVELPNHFLMTVNGHEMTIPNFKIFQKLYDWHFWIFEEEYFEQGLVIDKRKEGKHD